MSTPEFKDNIFFVQKVAKDIVDINTLKLFKNPNLLFILTLLRGQNKAMTVPDLVEAFKLESEKNEDLEPKSEKTIYRYLGDLLDGGLVVKGGKRVFPESEHLKTQTLYMRIAKIFFPVKGEPTCPKEEIHQLNIFNEVFTRLVTNHYKYEIIKETSLYELVKKMNSRRYEIARTIIKNTDEQTAEKLSRLNWSFVESLLESLALLSIFLDEIDWNSELDHILKKSLAPST